jgi:very-long-chain enoyl-CoA reductase
MSGLTKIDIVHAKKLTNILSVEISSQSTILDVKKAIEAKKSYLYPDRQMLKSDATGKPLKDEDSISNLKLKDSDAKTMKLYFKDLGPQVGWSTVNLIKMNFVVDIKK